MKTPVLKPTSQVTESATGLQGMITHVHVVADRTMMYCFQPRALNPETGLPVKSFWVTGNRLTGTTPVAIDLPLEVLGTKAEDRATGFVGTIIGIILHTTGCVHCDLQPDGKNPKTGDRWQSGDFDIRRLEGPAIPKLTEAEQEATKRPGRAHPRSSFLFVKASREWKHQA